jgi:TolB-like protein/Tfp pilus assembly protein PilF
VLRLLVEQAGRLISKEELMEAAWPGLFVSDDSLVQCIREIRRALDDADQTGVQNVPGRGYLFAIPVTNGVPELAHGAPAEADDAPPDRRMPALARRRGLLGWAVAAALCVVVAFGAMAMRVFDISPLAGPPSLMSVAVLPFERLGDLDADTAIALSDDLRAAMVHMPGRVAARQTSLRYREAADVTAIGRALDVRFVVGGALRRDGGVVRISVKLDDAVTGTQAWAESFEADAATLASGWDDLITRIYVRLGRAVEIAAAARSWQEHRDNPTARDFEIRGRGLMRKVWSRETFLAAREQFEQALRRDPDSLEATVRLAQIGANVVLGDWSDDRAGELARADALDRAVLARSPNSVIAHFVRAALLRAHGDYEQAIAAYQRTLELNPRMIWARAGIGRALAELGRFEEALEPLQTVLRIAPGDADAGSWYFLVGVAELMLGRDEAAVVSLRRSIEIDPANIDHRKWMIAACGLTDRRAEAERELVAVRARFPDFSADQLIRDFVSLRLPADTEQRAHVRDGLRRAGVLD